MIIRCVNLSKEYNKKIIVDKLNFEVEKGEIFALLGANGAGKTSTIKMLLGLTRPTSGEASIDSNIRVGFSPESPYFPPFLSGREVLEYYAGITGIQRSDRKKIILQLLEKVGLENDRLQTKKYSKGMLQRLSLAQALIGDPDLLILDEPTSGLDALGRVEMLNLIGDLRIKGITVLLNSHVLTDIERVCDRGIILKKGQLINSWEKDMSSPGETLEDFFIRSVKV